MVDESDQIGDLKKQMAVLTRTILVLVIAFLIASNLRLLSVLGRGEEFGLILNGMLAGAKVPSTTQIFTTYHLAIYSGFTAVTVALVFAVFRSKDKTKYLVCAVFVSVLSYTVAELAMQSYWSPIQKVIQMLAGP
ncbi:MAG: hypothetical protein AAGJ81_14315 [Verrucomicrobiota bacterium]